ncbi:MAG: LuxR C-terminal-related transcriptional regulator [Nocardioides sp.]
MTSPLLETKFHVPARRRGLVTRSRLSDRLSSGRESPLTLVSAPAGFGKSTLLTDWLATQAAEGRATAWLSLDERDNDPGLFWSYLVAALQAAVPEVGARALELLQSPESSLDAALATLLNDLNAMSDEVVVVLDDYHVIEASGIQEAMAFLLEHLPRQVRLVIASRADPALPLARLRARGELVEVRAGDLRFTPEEAAAYLNEMMGLDLTVEDVAALESRTEGWIAALQLAALSMQGRDDVADFIASFAGDDRYIVDYLVGEVLHRQPDDVRAFLLQTSVLSRLNGSLCDAVTGQDGGRAMLEELERSNMFVVPLDDRRLWYRYHHLFADMLTARLLDEQPAGVAELHRRASEWYEQHGGRPEAIRHATEGGHVERAADLIELAIPEMVKSRQEVTLRSWYEALPTELFAVRPVLSMGYVGAMMSSGEFEGVEARLRDAERWVETTPDGGPLARSAEMVVVDEERFRGLPSSIAVHRAGLALIAGDVAGTMAHAQRALDLAGQDDHLERGAAAALLGLAHWTSGDLDAAHRCYAEGMASLEQAGHLADVIGCALAVSDIQVAEGRLGDAMSTCERALQLATAADAVVLRGAADMHVAMSELLRERGDLDAARGHLVASTELGEHAGLPQNAYRWQVAMARVRESEGDLAGAVDLLDEAERRYIGDFFPNVRPVAAVRARLWIAQGAVDEALGWARERGLSVDDDLSYLLEHEHLTLARALLAQHVVAPGDRSLDEASRFLDRLLTVAEEGHRTGSVIEVLVLQALAHQERRDMPAALASLELALTRAEPEGYVRLFLDEGPAMAALLRAAAEQGVARDHARRVLAGGSTTDRSLPRQPGLVDPMSSRELEVLRLLRTDLSGPDIARELTVSLNTMRTHTKNIYMKLGVNNRREAVRRAEQLDL